MEKNKFSLSQRIKSFSHAFRGLLMLFKQEHNARVHLFAILIVVAVGLVLNLKAWEWVMIVLSIALVFMAELFNTAIERLCDKVDSSWNKEIGSIKDYSAAGVLVAAIFAAITGIFIFIPKFYQLICN